MTARADAVKARLAADKGSRPKWIVTAGPEDAGAQTSGGQAAAAPLPKEPEQSRDELMKMSISQLKELLREFGKSARGCLEKRDFVDRLKPLKKA